MKLTQVYKKKLASFLSSIAHFQNDNCYPHSAEAIFETMTDWSVFHSLDEVKDWFQKKRQNPKMHASPVAMKDLTDWIIDGPTGDICHKTNEYFSLHGLRVETGTRERSSGWDQPIVTQVGYDGGLVGIIRQRFEGVPHYLCEAKEEPGNYGVVQLSPTLQATFSNIKRTHGGRQPYFAEIFLMRHNNSNVEVLFDSWLAEDGGRFYKKRNRGILLEVNCTKEIVPPTDDFIWLSLFQVKQLLLEDAWVNPHLRGILSHV